MDITSALQEAVELGWMPWPDQELYHQDPDLAQALAAVLADFGMFISEATRDFAEGRVTDNELGRIEAEAKKAVIAIEALLDVLWRMERTARHARKPGHNSKTGEGAPGAPGALDEREEPISLLQPRHKRFTRAA